VTREEITALAQKHARNAGHVEGTADWYYAVMVFECQIEVDLELLHDILAVQAFTPPKVSSPYDGSQKRRRYWKKVRFTDGS
jgi:hypothetical protein